MAIRKFRSSWWVDFTVGGIRHRKRCPVNTPSGAKEYEVILRQRVMRGEPLDGLTASSSRSSPRFDEFTREWIETYVKPNLKPSASKTWQDILRKHLGPWFGERRLNVIGPADLERYKADKVRAGLLPQTVNQHLAVLHRLLQLAVEWGRLRVVPNVKKLKEPPRQFTFLTEEECDRLLSDRRDSRAHEMVLLALRTGMRLGEILALDWSAIDFDRGELTVRHTLSARVVTAPKSNKVRRIPLARDLRVALAARRQSDGPVFATSTGRLLWHTHAHASLHQLCDRTGVRRIGWHVLRHSFASHLVIAGVPLTVVQALLGHATLQMTQRYLHVAPSNLEQAIAVFDQRSPNPGQQAVNATVPEQRRPLAQHKERPVATGSSWGWPRVATLENLQTY